MARPQKNNADYFPHDNNMWSDRKIVALRNRHGLLGYGVWNLLLETLCESENFEIDYNESEVELLSNFWGLEPEELSGILSLMERLKLIVIEDGKLFSPKLKERLQPMLDERVRKRTFNRKRREMTARREQGDGVNEVNDVVNSKDDDAVTDTSTKAPARRIQKERKVKQSKGKKSKKSEGASGEALTPAEETRKYFAEIEAMNLPDDDERQKFYLYWTEKNKSGTKQRWELEKTFDVRRRFQTWKRRSLQFNPSSHGKSSDKRVSTQGHAHMVVRRVSR